MTNPYRQDAAAVLAAHASTPAGLTPAEAGARLAADGPNELRETVSRPAWRMLLAQFIEPMILILLAAAGFAFVLGNVTEGLAILAIVVLFGILGFIQEYRAEKAIAALKRLASPTVRVRRDNVLVEIPARDLVRGDIVYLETGNTVPADLRLLEAVNLRVMEAALTGEAAAVLKQTAALTADQLPLGDRTNMAFLGTVVVNGRGAGVVVATGMKTELGQIAGMIQGIAHARTPLQRKLAQVGKQISLLGLAAALAIFLLGFFRHEKIGELVLTAVSLLVAVVPEGLPAVITATLALGSRRMLKRHALIRRLPAVETLGAVTVICTDKTGTLTENRMTVTHLHTLHGTMRLDTAALPAASRADNAELRTLLLTAALCNDAHLVFDEASSAPRAMGDPTESALLIAAEQLGIATARLAGDAPRVAEYPFDAERKRMTTLHRSGDRGLPFPAVMAAPVLAATKGSLDGLLARATHVVDAERVIPLTDEIRQQFLAHHERLAREGIRLLGVAFRRFDAPPAPDTPADAVETDLVFCGQIGMMDPPRRAVCAAIASCHAAGIRTVMITGDHPLTAVAIAHGLRLAPDGQEPRVMDGTQLAALSAEELRQQVADVSVFARVSPTDKLRIVTALQERGHIVAMTGDGVNDSPALKRAEIGVAMGITGTDVAKEAAQMVLLDDNYSTLVAAVEEGRAIFDNLLRFLKYSFSGNLGKVLVMLAAPLAGIGVMALRPLHLLWLNLLTDGLMGLGLGLEPAEADVMSRPPRRPDARILNRPALAHIGRMGLFICLGSLLLAGLWYRSPWGHGEWQTVLFAAIGFAQVGQAWGLRALAPRPFRFGRNSALTGLTALTLLLQLGAMYIPALARVFNLQPLSGAGLAATIALGVVTFVLVHGERRLCLRRGC